MVKNIKMFIGGGGTGKSYQIRQMQGIKVCPTNLQCQIVGGRTIYDITKSPVGKLKWNNVLFDQQCICDECFMFTVIEMKVILQCCENVDLILFGDPYQLDAINSDYFYEAFTPEQFNLITITKLEKFYRQQDEKLINLINEYRVQKKSNTYKFQSIILDDAIIKIQLGFTIIVGNHKRREVIQNKIDKRSEGFFGSDGKKYRKGQYVYTVNKNGSLILRDKIIDYRNENNFVVLELENIGSVFPEYEKRLVYNIVSADVLTINVLQGQTLNGVIIDCLSLFQFGSFYTAITRVKKYEDIYIMTHPNQQFEVNLKNDFVY